MSNHYETITVGRNETFRKRFSQGETWGNKLIDITAPGAEFDIFCRQSGVTIHNIGIRGTFDSTASDCRFRVEVREGDPSETTVVDTVYWEGYGSPNWNNSGPKIYSHGLHEGHIEFRNMTIANLGDAGFYNSASGLPQGSDHPNAPPTASGGTYAYRNCHVTGCGTGHIRVTSDGSEVENCFLANGRGANTGLRVPWGEEGSTIWVSDSTFMDHGRDLSLGSSDIWGNNNDFYIHMDNVRWGTEQIDSSKGSTQDAAHLHPDGDQSSAGSPQWLEPNQIGAPESAEEAASGEYDPDPGDPPQEPVDFDEIYVPAGERHYVNLSDGETYENKLIDISNSGASVLIRARANDWTIRNIGVRGHWDSTQSSIHAMQLEVPSSSATGTIENVCMDISTPAGDNSGNGPGGPYVHAGHAGHIDVDRLVMFNFQDNGFYGSGPGNPSNHPTPGGGGTISITNSYANTCTNGLRLGTDGSTIENCVIVTNRRGYWGFYEDTECIDCDFIDNNSDIALGDSFWAKSDNATVTMTDSRWTGSVAYHGGTGPSQLIGSSVADPQHRRPQDLGAPATPEDAAGGGWGWDPDDDEEVTPPPPQEPDYDPIVPEVSTGGATPGFANARVSGSLDSLGGAPAADVYFGIRPVGGRERKTLSYYLDVEGDFAFTFTRLEPETDYEYRAYVETTGGITDTGVWRSFSTHEAADSARIDFESGDLDGWSGDLAGFSVN